MVGERWFGTRSAVRLRCAPPRASGDWVPLGQTRLLSAARPRRCLRALWWWRLVWRYSRLEPPSHDVARSSSAPFIRTTSGAVGFPCKLVLAHPLHPHLRPERPARAARVVGDLVRPVWPCTPALGVDPTIPFTTRSIFAGPCAADTRPGCGSRPVVAIHAGTRTTAISVRDVGRRVSFEPAPCPRTVLLAFSLIPPRRSLLADGGSRVSGSVGALPTSMRQGLARAAPDLRARYAADTVASRDGGPGIGRLRRVERGEPAHLRAAARCSRAASRHSVVH